MLGASGSPAGPADRFSKKRDRGFAQGHSQMENSGVETQMQSRPLKKGGQPGHWHGIEKDLKPFVLN